MRTGILACLPLILAGGFCIGTVSSPGGASYAQSVDVATDVVRVENYSSSHVVPIRDDDARIDARVLSESHGGATLPGDFRRETTLLTIPLQSPSGASENGSGLKQPEDPFLSFIRKGEQAGRPQTASAPLPSFRQGGATYSFDSREWIESFSGAGGSASDAFSSGKTSPVEGNATPSSIRETEPGNDLRVAAAVPAVAPGDLQKIGPGKPDLSPSYSKHLKYVKTCGVVVVQANFPLTEIQSILTEIELLQRDLNLYMGIPSPNEKIELCLFKDEKTYQRFLRDNFPKAPRDRRALYIKLSGKPGTLLVQRSKEFEVDLRHEMTHAVVHASIAVVPIWLDEGLAKYFEIPSGERAAGNPYLKTVRWNTRFGAVPSLRRLERLEHIGDMGSREYRDSWAWVHFLIHHSSDTHRLLAGYLQLLAALPDDASDASGSQEAAIPSLTLYLEDVLEKPREQYREHFRNWGVEE